MTANEKLQALRASIQSVLLGKEEAVRQVLVALLARGHVLLEDVPGVGKTILTRAIARSIDCSFSRIQLTPDLLPSDILGVSVYDSSKGEFSFKPGPIFAQIVLVDEINRTTPRTQSALLEAMNESQVTADGRTFPLGPPFMVLATQNPYEFEGTYFLPENQLDRFMIRVRIGYPDRSTERDILLTQPARTRLADLASVLTAEELLALQEQVLAVEVDEAIIQYILSIVEATRRSQELAVGLSPRASLAMMQAARAAALLEGRNYALPDDVQDLAPAICSHRLMTKALAADGAAAADALFRQILETVPVPL
ncbi:MAG: ATPase RavA [Planctomycetes bacterium ADurb.Bin126]|nr:MAG: ATPase RavA [Planctomycetes bacterium ADurb.Bin126]HOD83002.1 MoxR family ATPase [Phycisphaerae bacterium]HQL76024.1 MoxR family ATPase [Phycisphaerae bacterium]